MKFKKFFLWTLAATMAVSGPVFLTSCANDDNSTEIVDEDEPYVPHQQTILPVNKPAYVSDISEADYSKTVNALFPMRGSLDKVDIAVVTPAELGTYDGQLYDLYERGGLIVIARPDGSNYKKFVEQYGLEYKLPEVDSLDVFAFAFNKDHRYYCVYDYKEVDGQQKDKSYYVQLFNSFGEWVKENYESPANETRALRRADSGVKDPFNPHVDTGYPDEIFNLYFPTHLWNKITNHHNQRFVAGGDNDAPYDCGGYGGIRVATNVWYFYSFSDNPNISGDYYLIQSSVTAENSGLWTPKYYYHGAEKVFIIGYFMTKMDVDYRMCDWVEPKFPNTGDLGNPAPGTTINTVHYSYGFSWGLNGSLSVGGQKGKNGQAATNSLNVSGTVGWNIQFNKTEGYDYKDLNIINNSDGKRGYVTYQYQLYNFKPSRDWDKQKEGNGYPAISRSNMDTYASWLWRVPKGTHGDKGQYTVENGSESKFNVKVSIVPKFGTNHWWRAQTGHFFDDDYSTTSSTLSAQIHLSNPNRTPFGALAIKNGYTIIDQVVMSEITVWENDADTSKDKCLDSIPSTYSPGEIVKFALVANQKYKVRYRLFDTSVKPKRDLGLYEYSDIEIHSGEDEKSSTTEISILDSKATLVEE